MLIYFYPASKTIYGINEDIVREDADKYLDVGCIWIETEEIPELLSNQEWYLTDEGKIGVRDSVQQPLTQLDRIESAVSNTLDEIRAEAVDEYTLSLMENNII